MGNIYEYPGSIYLTGRFWSFTNVPGCMWGLGKLLEIKSDVISVLSVGDRNKQVNKPRVGVHVISHITSL